MTYLDSRASVAGLFLFVMIIITVSLIYIFGSPIVDQIISSHNGLTGSTQDAKDSVYNLSLLWKYGVPLTTIFLGGLWLIITALRERSGYV